MMKKNWYNDMISYVPHGVDKLYYNILDLLQAIYTGCIPIVVNMYAYTSSLKRVL